MRIGAHQNLVNPVEVHSTGDTRSFGIARNSHMFRILSDGLYSNKIAAVLREVGCNAQDAHIMAGSPDRPISVKLPTSLDRSFYIQDWGPGLSDDQLFRLYTTYGYSSKQDNDDTTGAFGLGSKSPFAYTASVAHSSDGFTVSSVHEGILRVYTCYIDESGSPCITKMFEGPNPDSTWPSGLKVSFAVQASDIRAFHDEAFNVFRWFKVKPQVLGLDKELVRPEYEYEVDAAKLVPKDGNSGYYGRHYSRQFHVLMGNVLYPIDPKNIPDMTGLQSSVLSMGGLIDAPIGAVLMAPSREVLQYTATTIKYLKGKLDEIADQIAARLKAIVDDTSKGRWAWAQALYEAWNPLSNAGLSSQFEPLLKRAGVSKDEIEKAVAAVREKIIPMPAFVGAADAAAQGIRVWACFESTRASGVSRQEIIDGRAVVNIRDKSTSSTGLPVNEKSAVVYVDSSYYYDRIKTYFNKKAASMYKRVLLVYAGGSAEKQKLAKDYAYKIAGCEDYRGIDILSLSALVPDYTPPARGTAAGVGATWAQKQGQEEVEVFGAKNQTLEDIVNDNEASDLYFIVHDDSGYRRPYYNENGWNIDYYKGKTFIVNAIKVFQALKPDTSPVVILVKTPGAARRLKLEDNGFRPFFVEAEKEFKTQIGTLNALLKGHQSANRLSKVKASCNSYNMRYQGLFGVMCFHYVHQTPFWSYLKDSSSAGVQFVRDKVINRVGNMDVIDTDKMDPDEKAEFQKKEELVAAIEHISGFVSISGLATFNESIQEVQNYDDKAVAETFLNISAFLEMGSYTDAQKAVALTVYELACEEFKTKAMAAAAANVDLDLS